MHRKCLTAAFVLDKNRIELDEREDDFKKYCERFPAKKVTCRGEPFWNNHLAKDLLADDVKSGRANELKPALLYETRKEYKEFTLNTFRKHIHQEKQKQRANPYWRHKRNIKGMYELMKERGINKQDWMETRMQCEIDRAASAFANLGQLE